MDRAELALLRAEIQEHLRLIQRLYARIHQRQVRFQETPEGVDSMAYQLHNLFGAYEELFETVADYFENHIEGARYHADLLRRMKLTIPGIRPALLSESLYERLDQLRRFRHFFRHAYGVDLDPERVGRILQIALSLEEPFQQHVTNFLEQLEKGEA